MKTLTFHSRPVSPVQLTLKHTFLNGQCFNWKPRPDGSFVGVLGPYFIHMSQGPETITYYNYPEHDIGQLLEDYFQGHIDFEAKKKQWS